MPLRPGNTASFKEMSQRWQAIGNTVLDLTGPRFEPQTSRSRDEGVTARPTGRLIYRNYRSVCTNVVVVVRHPPITR